MKISVCGSLHQKSSEESFRLLVEAILNLNAHHHVEIEQRFYIYLQSIGFNLGGISMLVPKGVIDTDVLLSIGGDGTFLRTSKFIAGTNAGIIGINSGHLGFLASLQPEEFPAFWAEFEADKSVVEERQMIECFVVKEDGHEVSRGLILNEVAISKRDTASMISVATYVNRELISNTDGDGLIISTPTGSTAYALSVNGPVIQPQSPVFLICYISPHTLNMRPIVLPNNVEIELHIESRSGSYLLAMDGRSTPEVVDTAIRIRLSKKHLKVLHPSGHSFYKTLRKKLMWGQDPRL